MLVRVREQVGHRYDLEKVTTNWAGLERIYVLVIAFLMNRMSAWHEHNSLWRGKEIISADWAIAFCIAFNTSMGTLERHWHAYITSLSFQWLSWDRRTLQWKKSFPNPSPTRHIPQSAQWYIDFVGESSHKWHYKLETPIQRWEPCRSNISPAEYDNIDSIDLQVEELNNAYKSYFWCHSCRLVRKVGFTPYLISLWSSCPSWQYRQVAQWLHVLHCNLAPRR